MRKKKIVIQEPKTLIDWLILVGQAAEMVKNPPRKRFKKRTRLSDRAFYSILS